MMSKTVSLFLAAILLLSGCGWQGQNEGIKGPAITHTKSDEGLPSDEDLIIGSRNQVALDVADTERTKKSYYSKEEAKELVKEHLQVRNGDSTSISFEGFENEEYLFHVFDLVHFNNHPEKLTRGWYKVNPQSGDVTLVQRD